MVALDSDSEGHGETGDGDGPLGTPAGVPVGLFRLEWLHNPLAPLFEHDSRARGAKRDDVALVLHTSGTTNKPKVGLLLGELSGTIRQ